MRAGLADEALRCGVVMAQFCPDGPNPSPAQLRAWYLACVDSLPEPGRAGALMLSNHHPEFTAGRPQSKPRSRKALKERAGAILDLREEAPGYSTRQVETIERSELAPAIAYAMVSGANEPLAHSKPAWTDVSLQLSVTQPDRQTLRFGIRTEFSTKERIYTVACCPGLHRGLDIVQDADGVQDTWIGSPGMDIASRQAQFASSYSFGVVRQSAGRTRFTEIPLRPVSPERERAVLGDGPASTQGFLRSASIPADAVLCRVRQEADFALDSHHFLWVADRRVDLTRVTVELGGLRPQLRERFRVIPFMPKYSIDTDRRSDESTIGSTIITPHLPCLDGHGLVIVW